MSELKAVRNANLANLRGAAVAEITRAPQRSADPCTMHWRPHAPIGLWDAIRHPIMLPWAARPYRWTAAPELQNAKFEWGVSHRGHTSSVCPAGEARRELPPRYRSIQRCSTRRSRLATLQRGPGHVVGFTFAQWDLAVGACVMAR